MLKNLRRLFSKSSGKPLLLTKMGSNRYFPNPMPDYTGQESETEIPSDYLKKSVEKIITDIEQHVKISEKNGRDGLYLGTAGISYMFYHLSKVPDLSEHKHTFLSKALEFLIPALKVCQNSARKDVPSFMLGNLGVYAVASVIYNSIGDHNQSGKYKKLLEEASNMCKEMNFLDCGSDELFVGRAGYILGALWLASETHSNFNKNDVYTLCNVMVESGHKYAQRHNSQSPLMYAYYQVEYLGAAHGLCTILQALLSVPGYLDSNPNHGRDVKNSVDYLLSLQDNDGNFPCSTDETGSRNDLVHWCHGAGGMIYLMAKAYLIWREQKYLDSCEKMGDLLWRKGLLKKGPGICHGVAGSGYGFLLLYRMTENPKYLYRAISFARFLQNGDFVKGARTPDYPFSLYEGVAGTACFLGDVLCPQKAGFPFSDIF